METSIEKDVMTDTPGYIKIENEGEIDVNALLLLGATSKRGDASMIGYFGSGLKYAIAVLLKNNIEFKIFSGEKEIKVTTTREGFRGQEFDVIKVNNRKTSLTTDMGPDWKAWFAVREIYCNAIDEGSHKMGISDSPQGEAGKTVFYIKFNSALSELFSNWNRYFSDKREDMIQNISEHGTRVFSGNGSEFIVYRKGVQCLQDRRKSLFHYDLDWVSINESRVLADSWRFNRLLAERLAIGASVEVIREIFDNYTGTVEGDLEWSAVYRFNDNWLKALNGRKIIIDSVAGYFLEEMAEDRKGVITLSKGMAESLKSYFGNRVHVMGLTDREKGGVKLKMTVDQAQDCKFALDFLKKAGIKVSLPVSVFEFENQKVLGQLKDGEILLSPKIFEQGRRSVVITILEEWAHKDSTYGDESRGLQNYLFNKWLHLLEERTRVRL